MPRALIGLGTNLGDRAAMLARAVDRLGQCALDLSLSKTYETAPAGGPGGQDVFLNAAVAIETQLAPHDLLAALQTIESQLGRVRGERWGARLIDLDLLLYDDDQGNPVVTATANLQVPHPRFAFRRFALQPAADVAPRMWHPLVGLTVSQLLAHLNTAPPYVALFGGTAERRSELVQAVAAATGARALLDSRESAGKDPTNGSSGPTAKARLQFLDETIELLAHRDWQSRQWVVSSFLAPQLVAELVRTQGADPAAFQVAQRADALIPYPRLLVLLDDWNALVAAHRGMVFEEDRERQAALGLAAVGKLPVLCAGRGDFTSQLNEITAALVAME
jgi:2-amino-4-hydroxy-6-hydroxymethyldihydropteridine diphosphokinase